MSTETKLFFGVIGGTLLLIFGLAFLLGGKYGSPTTNVSGAAIVDQKILVKSDSWKVGSDSAKVTVVEFSDFQCPSCKGAEPIVQSLISRYGNNLRLVYRHFPIPSHEFGFIAAQAAEAAGLQGKFWEMHDILFANQPDVSKPETANNFQKNKLVEYAQQLSLDTNKFTADLDSDSVRQKILNDQKDGSTFGVNATPTFFVNGTRLVGYANLEKEVSSGIQ